MEYKNIDYKGPSIKLNKLVWDTQSQDVILQIDTPVIGKINSKELNICNNERFKIINIEDDIITIQNEYKTVKFNAVKNSTFQRYFRVAFAGTCHSNQGVSIREKYLIHQYDKYCYHMKYVALSRATEYNNISIYINELSIDDMKKKQHKTQLKQAKLLELETEYSIGNDYDTEYYNYYNKLHSNPLDLTEIKSKKQILLQSFKCSHCNSTDTDNFMYINFNTKNFYCSSCEKMN